MVTTTCDSDYIYSTFDPDYPYAKVTRKSRCLKSPERIAQLDLVYTPLKPPTQPTGNGHLPQQRLHQHQLPPQHYQELQHQQHQHQLPPQLQQHQARRQPSSSMSSSMTTTGDQKDVIYRDNRAPSNSYSSWTGYYTHEGDTDILNRQANGMSVPDYGRISTEDYGGMPLEYGMPRPGSVRSSGKRSIQSVQLSNGSLFDNDVRDPNVMIRSSPPSTRREEKITTRSRQKKRLVRRVSSLAASQATLFDERTRSLSRKPSPTVPDHQNTVTDRRQSFGGPTTSSTLLLSSGEPSTGSPTYRTLPTRHRPDEERHARHGESLLHRGRPSTVDFVGDVRRGSKRLQRRSRCNACLFCVLVLLLMIGVGVMAFMFGQYIALKHWKEAFEKSFGGDENISTISTILPDNITTTTGRPLSTKSLRNVYPPNPLFTTRRRTDGKEAPISDKLYINGKLPIKHYRLPTNVIPHHYDVFMDLTKLVERHAISGHVKVTVDVVTVTKRIVMHAGATLIVRLTSDNPEETLVTIYKWTHNSTTGLLEVELDQPLAVGEKYKLTVDYRVRVTCNDQSGIVCAISGSTISGIVTRFEPALGNTVIPCFDEPHLKATFNVSLRYPSRYTVLSNMPVARHEQADGGSYAVDTFEQTPPMSTYVLAIAMGTLGYIEDTTEIGEVPVRIYAPAELLSSMQYALNYTSHTLDAMSLHYGHPYSLPKLDMIVMPGLRSAGAAAMEHWGLITYYYVDAIALVNTNDEFAAYKKKRLIAHELMHQWLGNLVTVDEWPQIWLQEAITTYVAMPFIGDEHLETFYTDDMASKIDGALLPQMRSPYRSSLVRHSEKMVLDDLDLGEMFDRFDMYYRGWMVVRMIEKVIGADALTNSISKLIAQNPYRSINQSHLFDTLGQVFFADSAHKPKDLFSKWLSNEGVPSVYVKYEGHGKLSFRQTTADINDNMEFMPDNFVFSSNNTTALSTAEETQLWPIMLKLRNQNDIPEEVYFTTSTYSMPRNSKHLSLAIPSAWIVANADYTAPMRVDYDDRLWTRLIDQLHRDHTVFTVFERMQFVIDAHHFLPMTKRMHLFLRLYAYLEKESELAPILLAVPRMHKHLDILQSTQIFALTAVYWKSTVISMSDQLQRYKEDIEIHIMLQHMNCVLQTRACRMKERDLSTVIGTLSYSNLINIERERHVSIACATLSAKSAVPTSIVDQLIGELRVQTDTQAQENIVTLLSCIRGDQNATTAITQWFTRRYHRLDWSLKFMPPLSHSRNDHLSTLIWCSTIDSLGDRPPPMLGVNRFPPHMTRRLADASNREGIHTIRTEEELDCARRIFGDDHPDIRYVTVRLEWLRKVATPVTRAWLLKTLTI